MKTVFEVSLNVRHSVRRAVTCTLNRKTSHRVVLTTVQTKMTIQARKLMWKRLMKAIVVIQSRLEAKAPLDDRVGLVVCARDLVVLAETPMIRIPRRIDRPAQLVGALRRDPQLRRMIKPSRKKLMKWIPQ